MNKLFIILFLLTPSFAYATWGAFGSKPIYKEPLAYPRSPETGFATNTSEYYGKRVYYFEAIIGVNIPCVTYENRNLILQFGMQASTWMDLGYKNGAFPLLTQDFYLAAPATFRYKDFSGAIKFNHISSHLGDGVDVLLDEVLTDEEKAEYEKLKGRPSVDVPLSEPVTYSRDYLSAHLSYDFSIHGVQSKIYGHIGYIHKVHPQGLKPWFLGNGFESTYYMKYFAPYYAQDVTWNQDMDSVDYSSQFGVIVVPDDNALFEMRLAATIYIGSDRRGQMVGRRLKQFGFGLFIR
ncbi:hypothetical protein LCGC14_1273800 [marine sediment metagenome]|uniref:Bacterial surface antigen (D15) domain-containing protein n=1 Tax=marine sediment metagenome TaxID=412755 RepID=A0A0F9P0D5_9ZZZZ